MTMNGSSGRVLSRVGGGVADITLCNRKQRNAVTPEMLVELRSTVDRLSDDENVRALILHGEGTTFSSGYAIDRFPQGADVQEVDEIELACRALENSPLIIIAALDGYAVGAGLDLAAACDLRVMSENARVGITPVRLGIVYGWPGTARLVRLLGAARARELLLTGELIGAAQAATMGLANTVVEPNSAYERAAAIAHRFALHSRIALAGTKRTIAAVSVVELDVDVRSELLAIRRASIDSEEARRLRDDFQAKAVQSGAPER